MHTILFFDDSFVESSAGLRKRWHSPELMAVSRMESPSNHAGGAYPSVVRDASAGIYRMWYQGCCLPFDGDVPLVERRFWYTCYGESEDGWRFRPVVLQDGIMPNAEDRRAFAIPSDIRFSGNAVFPLQGDVHFDESEPESARRFRLTYIRRRFEEQDVFADRFVCAFAYSPDGLRWTADESCTFMPDGPGMVSDTIHVPLWNATTGRWQMMVRPKACDRRIAVVESEDGHTWSRPRLVLEPDEDDPEAMQFYGMPVFRYEGMWIGFLWEMRTDPAFRGRAQGEMDVHLTFSNDGLHWSRASRLADGPRRAFIPLREEGCFGHKGIEAGSMLLDDKGDLRIYANGFLVDHSVLWTAAGEETVPMNILAYRLRRDGFVSLSAGTEEGELRTAAFRMLPDAGIAVNACIRGRLQAALYEQGRPKDGYGFADFTAWSGDERLYALTWRSGPCPPGLYCLALRWTDGDMYGIRIGYVGDSSAPDSPPTPRIR